ncbi:GNAT family N-acetyltransferase [Microbulbifer epialgicus]|uniref:GNAT family N-acetyltransferase n=1 Tax=Microbulbifer epialgicus TaxID=393907 RepID=A0ABV4P436_9GAMM
MDYTIRKAKLSDIPAIELLIDESVRTLAANEYTNEQIEGALKSAWGVDTQLISDETYFAVETGSQLIACGGWSYRETLFGNDSEAGRNPKMLNPAKDAAKIRAFFVRPSYARMGIGSALMYKCEREARDKGFSHLELMATLPGQKLYSRHGFVADTSIEYPLSDTLSITFIPMRKNIDKYPIET